MKLLTCVFLIFYVTSAQSTKCDSSTCNCSRKPNIIYILADDLGWNDIYAHGNNEACTPNIDAFLMLAIRFPRFYVHQMCSPSRGALLTGRWQHRSGLNCLVIGGAQPRCLPLDQRTLAEYLKECGYDTGLIGKWHLGHCSKKCWPKQRGFDYFLGYLLGRSDYYGYNYKEVSMQDMESYHGFDFREGNEQCYNYTGKYATDLFTEKAVDYIKSRNCSKQFYLQVNHLAVHAANDFWPLRVNQSDLDKFNCVPDQDRRNFTAMTYALDRSVGAIMQALNDTGLLKCTIVIFSSDNGGTRSILEQIPGTNFPLRGEKSTVYEGGIRVPAAIWYPCFRKNVQSRDFKGYFHLVDWLPTLLSAAKCNCSKFDKSEIDGTDMWETIATGCPSKREEIINIDPCLAIASVTKGDWKVVWNGSNSMVPQNSIAGRANTCSNNCRGVCNETTIANSVTAGILTQILRKIFSEKDAAMKRNSFKIQCGTKIKQDQDCKTPCLFNIKQDPCENENKALDPRFRPIYTELLSILEREKARAMPTSSLKGYPRANPKYWNCSWVEYCDFDNLTINVDNEEQC